MVGAEMVGTGFPIPEILRLRPAHAGALGRMFEAAAAGNVERFFHPHPLTAAAAAAICGRNGRDVYLGLFVDDEAAVYGMLRGWEEGYAVPALGILVAVDHRRRGLGLAMMRHLHLTAALAGAARIRLKVARGNVAARALYHRLGYRFEEEEGNDLIGYLALEGDR